MVSEVGAFEAKNKLGSLLDRVERGEEIVITRNGRAVARLIPEQVYIQRAHARSAAERLLRRATTLGRGYDWESIKADRDFGRR